MKLHFYIRFHTKPGETLKISGSIDQLGSGDPAAAVSMQYMNDQFWELITEIPDPADSDFTISYRYIFSKDGADDIVEWKADRTIEAGKIKTQEIHMVDFWNHMGEYENVFYTAPFRDVLLKTEKRSHQARASYKDVTHIFKIKAPLLDKNEIVGLLGNTTSLGAWDVSKVIPMNKEGEWWVVKLNLNKTEFPIIYKYTVYNTLTRKFVRFEDGENRILYKNALKKRVTVVHDGFIHLPNNTWRAAGTAIPVFSLRTHKSFGVGEFLDLKLLVDWADRVGMRLVQLLPVNDTISTHSWQDSYPYAAISAFALHPLYLNLEKTAGKKILHGIKNYKKKQQQLNDLMQVDYEEVMNFKLAALEIIYQSLKESTFAEEEYLDFFNKNKYWLIPYAAFSYLRDKYKTPDFTKWKQYQAYDADTIEKLCSPAKKHFDQIGIHYFIQYHLHLQLKEAHDYAHKHGIILKGDIPIGINRYGVDAWMEPALFDMQVQAGAPPDDFAVAGQNWGFPTYNWSRMQEDGYQWWKKRFEQMSYYFDAFRIDHILGFFRIWSIPIHAVEGIMGHFVPAIPVYSFEFHERYIWFDYNRYCKPYINDAVLWEMFGPNEKKFKPFLEAQFNGQYSLKQEFQTQKQVEDYFSGLEQNDENGHIKKGLFDLISNVILFEEGGMDSGKFHFRFNMENTTSFRHLEWHTGQQLKDLYVTYFYRRQDSFWEHEAMKKLPALKRATEMLICGEDLGMVPHCVPEVMRQLGFLSLEIQRMPKDSTKSFFNPAWAPYLSVVTPSTHDMSTIRGWWEEDRTKIQRFYNEELGKTGTAPVSCEAEINKEIILQHLYSPAQWSIFQMQDLLGTDEKLRRADPNEERINVPANPKHYWRYRIHIPLENLMEEKQFNDELKRYITASGRTTP